MRQNFAYAIYIKKKYNKELTLKDLLGVLFPHFSTLAVYLCGKYIDSHKSG